MSTFFSVTSYPLLAVLVFIGALGVPLPLGVALAAAGALARQGHVSLFALFVLCTAAAVGGDCLGYGIGRYGVAAVLARTHGRWRERICRWLESPRISAALTRGGGLGLGMWMLVFITRWALTAPSPVVNVLAGLQRYRWESFLIADSIGEALWVALSLAQGYW
ncbi:MAG TPA: VTT domain-containing protein, partial [Chloroflexota bacterium]|nr:VTT domain-containing protein [Chloroflexota bacterium]